jgi:hypothetical protein
MTRPYIALSEEAAVLHRKKLAEDLAVEWVGWFDQIRPYLVEGDGYHYGITDCWLAAVAAATAGDERERDTLLGHLGWLVRAMEKYKQAHRDLQEKPL